MKKAPVVLLFALLALISSNKKAMAQVTCCSDNIHCPSGEVCNGFHGDCQFNPQGRNNYCVVPTATPTPSPGPSPTPTGTGQVCCAANNQDCVDVLGPGWVCEDFAMGCVGAYSNTPNECVLDVIPTPIPGSGCNYTECRSDTDCDQVSGCRCVGYLAGIQRGLCYPPVGCGGFMEKCCEPDVCSGSLAPVIIQMSTPIEDVFIDVCFCFLGPASSSPIIEEPPMKCVPENQTEATGIDTAIGCISFANINPFTKFMLIWFIGLGGGIAFVLTVVAGAMITVSGGDPKRIAAGRELFVAALSGLLFLIFSVFMLRFIGLDILGIPGM
ncbi:hypothetical protein KKB40_02070 [Patescibacteria group bacterium]|nr:hypothetical protein [Patescibacteria group bacterium]